MQKVLDACRPRAAGAVAGCSWLKNDEITMKELKDMKNGGGDG